MSLLTKADRADRARREAETDAFLQWIVPGIDMLIQRCGLGLVGGLLGICTQRMECWKVAATRVCLLSRFSRLFEMSRRQLIVSLVWRSLQLCCPKRKMSSVRRRRTLRTLRARRLPIRPSWNNGMSLRANAT